VNLQSTNNYSYDLNGNLLSDGTRYFVYDDENELISVTVSNAWQSQFVYDGKMRRRIEKDYSWNTSSWLETNEIHFIYDGNLVIQERDVNNNPQVTYTRGNDLSGTLQRAGGIGSLLARTVNGQPIGGSSFANAYYHADGNGNVTMLIYSNQLTAAKYLYDPFGSTLSMSGPLAGANRYQFSSKEWNANSGLYYYLYRFYDPNLQRWLNRDPIEEWGGYNLYEMTDNNPVNEVDLFGLDGAAAAAAWGEGLEWAGGAEVAGGGPEDPAADAAALAALAVGAGAALVCEMSHNKPRHSTWDKHTKPRAGGPEKKDDRMQKPPPPRGPKPPPPPYPPNKGPKQKF
jgi:RHS repeat-associated protein